MVCLSLYNNMFTECWFSLREPGVADEAPAKPSAAPFTRSPTPRRTLRAWGPRPRDRAGPTPLGSTGSGLPAALAELRAWRPSRAPVPLPFPTPIASAKGPCRKFQPRPWTGVFPAGWEQWARLAAKAAEGVVTGQPPSPLLRTPLPSLSPGPRASLGSLGTGGPARGAGSGRPSKQEMKQRQRLIGHPAFLSGDAQAAQATRLALRGCLPGDRPPCCLCSATLAPLPSCSAGGGGKEDSCHGRPHHQSQQGA